MSRTVFYVQTLIASCLLIAAPSHADDTAKQRLLGAIAALKQQDSYRWSSKLEVPEESRFRPGPTTGTTERNGLTHVTTSFGPRTSHVVIDGTKAAVTDRDGRWETLSLLDEGYRSAGFAASLARGVQLPAAEARQLVAAIGSLTDTGDALAGILSVDAVQDRLISRRREEDVIRDLKGTARFWITDGVLRKYVIRVEGNRVDGNDLRHLWRQITVEIEDIGTAKIDLPRGAAEALRRPVPEPESRLSETDAARLLESRGKREVGVHDPSSIVKCDGEYWFFSTGQGVSSWRSNDLQSWERGPRVFPDIPAWVTDVVPDQRGHFWAPDIIWLNDRFWLYYSVSAFGKNTSAIALASTPTLNPDHPAYEWADHGIVIQSAGTDDFNAIDPAVIRTDAGELWMSFGSFWSGIRLIQLDPRSSKRLRVDGPIYSLAYQREIEAPHIYEHDGWFYLFVNWGKCCRGVDSTYTIRVGRSRQITGPYLDKDGVDLAAGGGTLLLGTDGPFIGPGHANVLREDDQYILSCHYYDGTERGRSMLSIQELSWSKDQWPVVAAAGKVD